MPSRRFRLRRLPLPALLGLLLAAPMLAPAQSPTPKDKDGDERDACLFVGISVALSGPGGTYPVTGFDPLNEIILGGDPRRTVPVSQTKDLRFLFEPKLGRALATLSRIEYRQSGTTPSRNPREPAAGLSANGIESHYFATHPVGEPAAPGLSSLVVSFDASSPEPVANTYALGVVTLGTTEGVSETLFFQYIGRLDSRPRPVRAHQDGLPTGCEVQRIDIHLFTNGEELPTNLSKKRFNITRDEAQDYLIVNHVASHRFESLPPAPVWSLAPAALRASDNGAGLDFKLTADIDERGNVVRIRRDGMVVPEQVIALAYELPFVPALSDGEPVRGVANFNLADYFR